MCWAYQQQQLGPVWGAAQVLQKICATVVMLKNRHARWRGSAVMCTVRARIGRYSGHDISSSSSALCEELHRRAATKDLCISGDAAELS
jgi:hypothetical protein